MKTTLQGNCVLRSTRDLILPEQLFALENVFNPHGWIVVLLENVVFYFWNYTVLSWWDFFFQVNDHRNPIYETSDVTKRKIKRSVCKNTLRSTSTLLIYSLHLTFERIKHLDTALKPNYSIKWMSVFWLLIYYEFICSENSTLLLISMVS